MGGDSNTAPECCLSPFTVSQSDLLKEKIEITEMKISTFITFRSELENVINRNSKENGSNTPDFILAEYLINCLKAFDLATNQRTMFYRKNSNTETESTIR